MGTHEFTLIIDGDPGTPARLNALYEAGCDDATFGSIGGQAFADFTREAFSQEAAIASAVHQVESVGGLRVKKIVA
jgi:hypothetical protein